MNYEYDKIYIRPWGSSGVYSLFPYKANGVNETPEYDASQNDVDLDSYTNTIGKTVRNRVRHDVKTLNFSDITMSGQELKDFFDSTKTVWLQVKFFDESAWDWVEKKMYRSGTVSYHKYYMNPANPLLNIYTNVSFDFIEE